MASLPLPPSPCQSTSCPSMPPSQTKPASLEPSSNFSQRGSFPQSSLHRQRLWWGKAVIPVGGSEWTRHKEPHLCPPCPETQTAVALRLALHSLCGEHVGQTGLRPLPALEQFSCHVWSDAHSQGWYKCPATCAEP